MRKPEGKPAGGIFAPYRGALAAVGVFSLFLNLLVLTLPVYMLQVYDRVLSSQSLETLVMLTLVAAGALLTFGALDAVRARVLLRVGTRLHTDLSGAALAADMQRAQGGGARAAQGPRDCSELRNFLTGPAIISLFDAPWLPLFVAVIFLLHPVLGWVALAGALLLFGIALVNELATRRPLGAANQANTHALARAEGAVRNADVIHAMGMLPGVLRRWQGDSDATLRHLDEAGTRAGGIGGTTKFCRSALQIAILGLGAWLVIGHEITPGAMIAASILMGRALAPVELAIGGWRSLVSARGAYGRLKEALSRAGSCRPAMPLPAPAGRLSVEGVHFTPPGAERPTLHNVSFLLEPGEVLGIIGPSAAGKSTLARLVVGVWPASRGVVRLDDADVYAWDATDLGRHVGYLPQDVQLFSATVRENVARMDPDASPEAIVAAARRAGAHEMILRLPQGYETEIGDGGLVLSGGQRQRIGLARALYGEPRLLVLDEPNANLDGEAEQALMRAIGVAKAAGATVLIISHRPSMISPADKLLLLRDGAVEMFGPRHEILPRVTRQSIQPAAATAS